MNVVYWRKYLHQSSAKIFGLIEEEILYYITITFEAAIYNQYNESCHYT